MTKVVDLHDYRTKVVEQRAFGPWQKRFGETYHVKTCLSDLSDKTLFILAQPGEHSSIAYYETIMGTLYMGPATKFDYLASEEQMRVVDIHLFLADQIRFEMMRRLEWLDSLPCQNITIIAMVQEFDRVKEECRGTPPELARADAPVEDDHAHPLDEQAHHEAVAGAGWEAQPDLTEDGDPARNAVGEVDAVELVDLPLRVDEF